MTENMWDGKRVLITGVCGTVGSELLNQLSKLNCEHIVGIDNNETELFFLGQQYINHNEIELFLGDLRDRDAIFRVTRKIDIILHSAALKHVILCERSPRDAVATNIDGMMNIVDAAEMNGVKKLIFTSSDKAVNPTNVMGTTKLMGERLMTAANAHRSNESDTIYASTRFGNVLGSRGSVLPLFERQIKQGGPVTITDQKMTRFIMTLHDAVALVLGTTWIARGGEVFVTKMPVINIVDLAEVMIELLAPKYGYERDDIQLKIIGAKPGEKLYEELLSDEEVRRTIELDQYFTVLPAFKAIYQDIDYGYDNLVAESVEKAYNSSSEEVMSKEELKNYLLENRLLEGIE